ncbi:MAG: COX15/CtaA family protein [Bdellovibrionia bacterium]
MKTSPTVRIHRFENLCRFSWIVLFYTILVIVWGAYVRATGSGAGCGNHWPLCNGRVIPRQPVLETLVEYSHRITSGLSVILISVLAAFVFKIHSKGHLARKAAAFSVLFIFQEALIGAGLVLYGLVTHNQSAARVFSLGLHLGNTFLLTAALALTAVWSRDAKAVFHFPRSIARYGVWAAVLGCLAIGITGSIAALGDTLWPSQGASVQGLVEGIRNDLSSTTPTLLRLRVFHPVLAISYGLCLILGVFSVIAKLNGTSQKASSLGTLLIVLVVTQLGIGITNLALLAPVWIQMIHLLLANTLWITLILFIAALYEVKAFSENQSSDLTLG